MRLRRNLSIVLALCGVLAVGSVAEAQRKGSSKKKPTKKPAPLKMTRLPDVAEVDPNSRGSVLATAARIDRLVEQNYREHNVTPNEMTTDEQFVRRIHLDIVGRIPTLKETESFLRSRDPGKRARLIDDLLNSYGYVSHNYNYWGGILRLQNRPDNNIVADAYLDWVKKSLQENTPYDEWVRQMLTAEGKLWENPATGYILRDSGMPLNHVSNTVRVFLGTQIGCAQCHDHPFDRWTQQEFYELAALMHGTQTRTNRRGKEFGGKDVVAKINKEMRDQKLERKDVNKVNRVVRANLYEVWDAPRKLRYPADYAYDNAKPKGVVSPGYLFDVSIGTPAGKTPRDQLASWMTSPHNPRFTKTIANRLWKRVFGIGQFEPVDDIKDDTVAENPELMNLLEATMQRVDFDMKEYLRILYNTKTYQRQATAFDLNPVETYHFPGPLLRRMSAEQLWDSFLTLSVVDPNRYRAPDIGKITEYIDADLASTSVEELKRKGEMFDDFTRGKTKREREKMFRYKGNLLARASELPVPAPAGHFLRQFGQGDRELIDGENADGSVTQILTMFNGPITHMMLEGGSTMYKNVTKEETMKDRVDVIFLSILSREPTGRERGVANQEIRDEGASGYGNVIWALVNTREFLFIQ